MTKKKAKKLIAELKKGVNVRTVRDQFWMDKVQAYTQTIFGDHTQSIALPMFGTYYNNERPFNQLSEERAKERVVKLKEMFKVYQEMIDNRVFLPEKNFLSNDSNGTLLGILVTIILTVGTGCFYYGQYITDVKNWDLQQKVKHLEKKLDTYKQQTKTK